MLYAKLPMLNACDKAIAKDKNILQKIPKVSNM